ncbi:MAG: transcription elongation factor GreA [Mollicutes bacterium]|nr:transcription elongation factor GreA [Mollicutes bacterium]
MTNKKEFLMTAEGYLKIETELNDLKLNKRPEVIKAVKEARSAGDLSENADYDAARADQAQLEMKIKELEFMLENSKIIENGQRDIVDIGSTVTISYVEENDEEEYKIVGSLEADPFNNKISNESPIGVAIMGKKVGDVISVESPTGAYAIEITKIA